MSFQALNHQIIFHENSEFNILQKFFRGKGSNIRKGLTGYCFDRSINKEMAYLPFIFLNFKTLFQYHNDLIISTLIE